MSNFEAMIDSVIAIDGSKSRSDVLLDLEYTKSAEETINRIFDGKVSFFFFFLLGNLHGLIFYSFYMVFNANWKKPWLFLIQTKRKNNAQNYDRLNYLSSKTMGPFHSIFFFFT